ncbi:MAG: DNA topoisomerase (ATP-hydrolyzing) subunit A [Candidatus Anstonellales archaeon]
MEITNILLDNYLPYSKGVIVSRAIPAIDGLKPVQRRVLYTMYKMGLLKGNKVKSSNIIGQTMMYHPHGDMSIYESMVRMTTGHEALNMPYIESKGSFGKVYSKDIVPAAYRYTEAKLADICNEIFDEIDYDAVDFIDNFDNTLKEPVLLPVKFPSILVNTSSGIAVATSSNIPSFSLKNVCKATIGILKGDIDSDEKLAEVIGVPEFTTGGIVNISKEDLIKLIKTGKGTITITGRVEEYSNKIVITEIPYKTTVEEIVNQIEELVKNGEMKEISNVRDEIDLKGFRLVVELKRGSNSSEVLKKLYRYTSLRNRVSFQTRVIIDNRCVELGIYELLNKWIEFRIKTVERVYRYKLNRAKEQEHILKVWEVVKDSINDVANRMVNMSEEEFKRYLKDTFNLDDIQVEYILDVKVKNISKDNVDKKLKDLKKLREEIEVYRGVIDDDNNKKALIIEDLERIIKLYGKDNRTMMGEPITEEDEKVVEVIDDREVRVVITKKGYIKRYFSDREREKANIDNGDIFGEWVVKNTGYVLVFTYSGECYKVKVNDIDASRGGLKDNLISILGIQGNNIMYVDVTDDFRGYFNIVYLNGRGMKVYYDRVAGNRSKYRSLYEPCTRGNVLITKSNKFFAITKRNKGVYCDLSMMDMFRNRVVFKLGNVGDSDIICKLIPVENIANMDKIDISRYTKGYFVKMIDDLEIIEG